MQFFLQTANYIWDAEAPALKLVCLREYKKKKKICYVSAIHHYSCSYVNPNVHILFLLYIVFKTANINLEEFLFWNAC